MNKWLQVMTASACTAVFLWFFGYFISTAYYLSFEHWDFLEWHPVWRSINAIVWFVFTSIFIGVTANE